MMADPANSEEVSVQFIAEEIELGLAFATLAATEYAQGRVDRAREVRAKGGKAGAQAERRLQEAQERGWDVGILRERLRDLRKRMDEIEGEAKAA